MGIFSSMSEAFAKVGSTLKGTARMTGARGAMYASRAAKWTSNTAVNEFNVGKGAWNAAGSMSGYTNKMHQASLAASIYTNSSPYRMGAAIGLPLAGAFGVGRMSKHRNRGRY